MNSVIYKIPLVDYVNSARASPLGHIVGQKIPYRRASAWPGGFRPNACASKGILHTLNNRNFVFLLSVLGKMGV